MERLSGGHACSFSLTPSACRLSSVRSGCRRGLEGGTHRLANLLRLLLGGVRQSGMGLLRWQGQPLMRQGQVVQGGSRALEIAMVVCVVEARTVGPVEALLVLHRRLLLLLLQAVALEAAVASAWEGELQAAVVARQNSGGLHRPEGHHHSCPIQDNPCSTSPRRMMRTPATGAAWQ